MQKSTRRKFFATGIAAAGAGALVSGFKVVNRQSDEGYQYSKPDANSFSSSQASSIYEELREEFPEVPSEISYELAERYAFTDEKMDTLASSTAAGVAYGYASATHDPEKTKFFDIWAYFVASGANTFTGTAFNVASEKPSQDALAADIENRYRLPYALCENMSNVIRKEIAASFSKRNIGKFNFFGVLAVPVSERWMDKRDVDVNPGV